MKVISLVPSWTETLLSCGVRVIGRTRYCIHPERQVADIPALGGTKRFDWSKWRHLDADLVVMDRDENTREMAEQCPFPVFASHVRGVRDVARDCDRLAAQLDNDALRNLARRWEAVCQHTTPDRPLYDIPAVVRWVRHPSTEPRQLLYLIWRKPWMAAGGDTFIGSMLRQLGFAWAMKSCEEPYPVIDLEVYDPGTTLLLLSTEPYPFENHLDKLADYRFPMALVDGEAYSWFGVRALRFLEDELGC